MNRSLENYEPIGNQVLLRVSVKTHSEGGLELGAHKKERWMEVAKVGAIVDKKVIDVGDTALMGEPMQGVVTMKFGEDEYIQVSLHDIVGRLKLQLVDPKLN